MVNPTRLFAVGDVVAFNAFGRENLVHLSTKLAHTIQHWAWLSSAGRGGKGAWCYALNGLSGYFWEGYLEPTDGPW